MELTPRANVGIAAAILVAAGAVYSIRLSAPFEHYHENVTACYANWGRNYLRFGYGASSGAPIKATGIRPESGPPVPRQLYTHRPPTVSLLLSVACRMFGATEATLRGFGVVASLATLAVFMVLARRLLGPAWGLAASALFAFIPDFAFYGVAVAHQTFGILGALSILLAALRWQERPGGGRLAALLATTMVACWLDWPAFYGAGAAGLLIVLTAGERRWIGVLVPAAAVASLGLFVVYLWRLDPVGLVAVKDFLSTGSTHSGAVPIGGYLAAHVREAIRWFTIPVLLLAAVGAGRLRPRGNPADLAILLTGLLGADSVLFSSLTYGHLFMTVPLVPFAALAAARGLRALSEARTLRLVAAAMVLGFAAQAGLTLRRAHAAERYPYYGEATRALASTLKSTVARHERVLVRITVDKHVLSYYADRPAALYSTASRTLDWLDEVRLEDGVDDEAVLRLLEMPERPFSWVVTTTLPLASERLATVRGVTEEFAQRNYDFESERSPSTLVTRLRARFPESRRDGFLFFDLRR